MAWPALAPRLSNAVAKTDALKDPKFLKAWQGRPDAESFLENYRKFLSPPPANPAKEE